MTILERSIWVFIASMILWSPPWLSSAYALENVHDETWEYSSSKVVGQFEGDLTEHDLQSGITFSVVRTGPNGGGVELLR